MRVIIAKWSDGRVTTYSSVVMFLAKHPGRCYQTIMSYLTRKKEAYKDDEVTLIRSTVVNKK